jgi:hypothetical protein
MIRFETLAVFETSMVSAIRSSYIDSYPVFGPFCAKACGRIATQDSMIAMLHAFE